MTIITNSGLRAESCAASMLKRQHALTNGLRSSALTTSPSGGADQVANAGHHAQRQNAADDRQRQAARQRRVADPAKQPDAGEQRQPERGADGPVAQVGRHDQPQRHLPCLVDPGRGVLIEQCPEDADHREHDHDLSAPPAVHRPPRRRTWRGRRRKSSCRPCARAGASGCRAAPARKLVSGCDALPHAEQHESQDQCHDRRHRQPPVCRQRIAGSARR